MKGDGKMEVDLLHEIKSLNTLMVKRLFSMKKESENKIHPKPLQFGILEFLSENKDKDIYQRDLEQEFKISKAAISGVLNTMEKHDMILRIQSKDDARKNKIVLSESSEEHHQEFLYNRKRLNQELLEGVSEEELEQFLEVVEKFKKNMKREGKI